MKITTAITLFFSASLVLFLGNAVSDFSDGVKNTADTATTQPVSGISEGFDAAFTITD